MRSCTLVPSQSVVFLRTGMDVPLANGRITDPTRIEETRPTIDALRAKGCKLIVATHIGRPKGADPMLSAKPVADYLAQFYPVHFVPSVVGEQVATAVRSAQSGDLVVIENLRYDAREEQNDAAFAQALVADATCIVQDAYANCHRSHASMTGVLQYKKAYAGLLLEKELTALSRFAQPQHPYVAIIGGAKADKLSTIEGLLKKADTILVGGVLANTFLKAAGFPVGDSKVDEAGVQYAAKLYASGKILLPIDVVLAKEFRADAEHWSCGIGSVNNGMILDIGPRTVERYAVYLRSAKTIVWGGPIGVFEWPAFSEGTQAIAKIVAESGAFTLAAGGDSGAALVALGYKDRISHVSTGGGVTLELLEGKELVVVQALAANERTFP